MSFASKTTLQSFVGDNDWLTDATEDPGVDEAILQADDIINTYTGIDVPNSPDSANGMLRNVACALVVWYTTGQQAKLSEQEYQRRRDLYRDAMSTLQSIRDGDLIIPGSGPAAANDYTPFIYSTRRMDTDL